MKVIFELSGEHPLLPAAEAASISILSETLPQVAVGICPEPSLVERLALTHNALEYLGECGPGRQEITALLRDLNLASDAPFCIRVKRVMGSSCSLAVPDLERLIGSGIKGPVSLDAPVNEYRAVLSGDRIFLGRKIWTVPRNEYCNRKPGNRIFFHPGVMMPRMARVLVNLSGLRRGEVLYDPFCGTGGILIEAGIVGGKAVGSDVDPLMTTGALRNDPESWIFTGDACSIPLAGASVDTVVTDLPYGQSVQIRAENRDQLTAGALEETGRVLKKDRRAVIVANRIITSLVPPSLSPDGIFSQRVHKSLTRFIHVLHRL